MSESANERRLDPLVRLTRHLNALERVAGNFPYSEDARVDSVQRTIMDILVSEGRYEVASNGFWRKTNGEGHRYE